jgi:hypothetical protein
VAHSGLAATVVESSLLEAKRISTNCGASTSIYPLTP